MHLRLLKIALGFAAAVWGAAVFGIFLPWETAAETLQGLGAKTISYDPMLDYWLRMTAGAFTLIGCGYLLLLLQTEQFHAIIPWAGGLMLVEGVILLTHGLRLSLPPFPFYADTAACLLDGVAIIYLSRHTGPSASPSEKPAIE